MRFWIQPWAWLLLAVCVCWAEGASARHGGEEVIEETVVADEADTAVAAAKDTVAAADEDTPPADDAPLAEENTEAEQEKKPGRSDAKPHATTAKNKTPALDPAMELLDPRTYQLKIVIRVDAPDGALQNVAATTPIPIDWPEQRVRLLSQKLTPRAKCGEQLIKGQAGLLKFQVSQIPRGGSASVERIYEITRYRMKFSMPGEELKIPHSAPAELKDQLAGEAPGIELKNSKLVSLSESLRGGNQDAGPWELAKAFWSWTRENVKYENDTFRGATFALETGRGDCEEMSALFVGLCRLSNIPARSVWVEGHDYPEFYLLDGQGRGHWIPAQLVGPPWFGEMAEYRPIFQKGDRFYDGLQKKFVRYAPRSIKESGGKSAPQVEFRQEILSDSDVNGPAYRNTR